MAPLNMCPDNLSFWKWRQRNAEWNSVGLEYTPFLPYRMLTMADKFWVYIILQNLPSNSLQQHKLRLWDTLINSYFLTPGCTVLSLDTCTAPITIKQPGGRTTYSSGESCGNCEERFKSCIQIMEWWNTNRPCRIEYHFLNTEIYIMHQKGNREKILVTKIYTDSELWTRWN